MKCLMQATQLHQCLTCALPLAPKMVESLQGAYGITQPYDFRSDEAGECERECLLVKLRFAEMKRQKEKEYIMELEKRRKERM